MQAMQPCDIHTAYNAARVNATYAVGARARTPPACSGAADKHEGVEYLAYASHGATAGITVPWAHSCGAVSCGAHACTPLKSATACGPYRLRLALSHCAGGQAGRSRRLAKIRSSTASTARRTRKGCRHEPHTPKLSAIVLRGPARASERGPWGASGRPTAEDANACCAVD